MPRPAGSKNKRTLEREAAERLRREEAARAAAEMAAGLSREVSAPVAAVAPVVGAVFVEYETATGEAWRAEAGSLLLKDFDIAPGESRKVMPLWHEAFAVREQAWLVLRRLYAIAPMLGEASPDDLRAWTASELSDKIGVGVENIEAIRAECRAQWRRYRISSGVDRGSAKGMAGADEGRPLTEEEITALLTEHGFGRLTNEDERRWAAKRCRDLLPYLEDEEGCSIARNAISEEVNLFFALDRQIEVVRGKIAELSPNMDGVSLEKRLMDLLNSRRVAVESHGKSMERLGATQVQKPTIGRKLAFTDCLSQLVGAMQEYRSRGDTALIDGLFTAAEVELQLKETTLRPAQYRPDIVVSIVDAMDHLWENDWEPKGFSRDVLRKLRAGFKSGVAAIQSDLGEIPEELDGEEDQALTGDGGGVMEAGTLEGSGEAGAPQVAPPVSRDDIAVV